MWDKETAWKKAVDYLLISELDLISKLPLNSSVQAPLSLLGLIRIDECSSAPKAFP